MLEGNPRDPGATMHGLFEQQAARSPEAPAVLSATEEYTYAELNARANRLARLLRGLGVGPEKVVAIVLERSAPMVPAILAVLKAGGAYLPIDPSYPPDRISLMLEDSRAAVVLTQESVLEQLPATASAVVCVDRDAEAFASEDDDNLGPTSGPRNLAYVIYTSGSTGRPKGVAVPHSCACHMARGMRGFFTLGPGDRVLLFAALGFDAAVEELATALLSGAALYVPTETKRRWRLRDLLVESGTTMVTLPPSTLAGLSPDAFPALTQVIVAGEEFPPALAREWGPGRRVFNGYGPTEGTVCATLHHVEALPPGAVRVPIGTPLEGVRIYVLDADLEPAEEGELYIGGDGVARGYLFKPALTAARFMPDPFSPTPGARMYRSGDLARRREDGLLEFVGRVDDQVKVGGFRIEPAEVEAALVGCLGIREAVVLATKRDGTKRLTAYLVCSGEAPDEGELRSRLLEALPAHMVPAEYVVLDAFPRTPNEKIDRKRLLDLGADGTSAVGAPEPSETATDDGAYVLVANDEDQHAIWPASRAVPAGWRHVAGPAPREECLEQVMDLWPDLRPRSLRDVAVAAQGT